MGGWQEPQYQERRVTGQHPATPPQWQRGAPPRQDGTRSYGPQDWEQQYQQQPRYTPPQQPYYAPQPYAPQPYAPPPRKRRTGLKVFLGVCGGLFLIGVIAAVASPSSSTSSAQPATASQSHAAAAPAPAQHAKAATAKTVATFKGDGVQSTPQFTVTSNWKLDYSFDCSSFGYAGNFIVMEDGGLGGAMDVNTLAMSKSSSSYAYGDAGQHYIKVDSECSWTLKVVDEG